MLRADWRTLRLCRVQIGVPSGVSYTWGRESKASYNESAAGSQNAAATGYPYGIEYINPFDAAGDLLPLLRGGGPVTPYGSADRAIQAYNFRLCVTNNATIRAPFTKPPQYDPARWELLRRFWLAWPNSTNAHKAAQVGAGGLERERRGREKERGKEGKRGRVLRA